MCRAILHGGRVNRDHARADLTRSCTRFLGRSATRKVIGRVWAQGGPYAGIHHAVASVPFADYDQ